MQVTPLVSFIWTFRQRLLEPFTFFDVSPILWGEFPSAEASSIRADGGEEHSINSVTSQNVTSAKPSVLIKRMCLSKILLPLKFAQHRLLSFKTLDWEVKGRTSTHNTYSRFFTLASLSLPSYLSKVMGIKYSCPASFKSISAPESPAFPQFSSTYNKCVLCNHVYPSTFKGKNEGEMKFHLLHPSEQVLL